MPRVHCCSARKGPMTRGAGPGETTRASRHEGCGQRAVWHEKHSANKWGGKEEQAEEILCAKGEI